MKTNPVSHTVQNPFMPWSSPVLIWQSNIHFSMLKSSSLAVHRYRHELKHMINTIIYTWINIQTKTRIYKLIYLINIHSIDDKTIHVFCFGRAIGFDPSSRTCSFTFSQRLKQMQKLIHLPGNRQDDTRGYHQRWLGSIMGISWEVSWEYLGNILGI